MSTLIGLYFIVGLIWSFIHLTCILILIKLGHQEIDNSRIVSIIFKDIFLWFIQIFEFNKWSFFRS